MTVMQNLKAQPNPPKKDRTPAQNASLFSTLSIVVCLLVLGYGGYFLISDNAFGWVTGFGSMSIIYAILALGALVCAYRSGTRSCVVLSQVSGAVYLLVYVLVVIAGVNTGFGPFGILLVGLLVWCNWIAVNRVVRRP